MKITMKSRIPFGFDDRWKVRDITSQSIQPSAKFQPETEIEIPDQEPTTVQKKIVPWERLMQTDLDFSSDRLRPQLDRNPLIVVATLVSKIPNLGGLCRTCETFNAELLVVNNLRVKNDPNFLATCVSAEKWMPMHQVREPELEEYLLLKKSQGYALIGIEQATNSTSLEKVEFPVKSLLLLGKEKEGIPTYLLPLMDFIIEIPQFGLIRSLNVHVSGSLIIWEYIKSLIQRDLAS
jgi:tRNA G18 (ribose-2'-O)-methylase SpoU